MEQSTKNFNIQHTITDKPVQKDFPMHTHKWCEFYYFIRGEGVFHIEGTDYYLKKGDILIMDNTESHYIEIDTKQVYERLVVHFDKEFVKQIDEKGILLTAIEDREHGKNNLIKRDAFDTELYQMLIDNILSDIENKVQVETNFLALLNEIAKAYKKAGVNSSDKTQVNQIVNYILGNLENEFTLEDICKEFYISKPQLCRMFKKSMGSTIWNYVTIKRLSRAEMLITNGCPPTHAYTKCGFSDYSCFYRAYKKIYGTAPSKIKHF